jgi:hypothetical protein
MNSFRPEAEAAAGQMVEATVPHGHAQIGWGLEELEACLSLRPCKLCCSALVGWYPGTWVVVAMLMEEEECDDPPLLPSDKAEADIASLQGKVQI